MMKRTRDASLHLLLCFLAACFHGADANDAGKEQARFDLTIDLRGAWTYDSHKGCEEYMAITGTTHFEAGPMLCVGLSNGQLTPQSTIWQDCLEMTISGPGAPLHHMILNDEYLTDDWTSAGTPAQWKSKIVAADPTKDVGAVSPTVVFYSAETGRDVARRYLNADGQMVQSWTAPTTNATNAGDVSTPTAFQIIFNKTGDLPCQGYRPTTCIDRTYSDDGVGAEGWTPACCLSLEAYGSFQPNPNVRSCDSTQVTDDGSNGDSSSSSGRSIFSLAAVLHTLMVIVLLSQ